MRAARIHAWGAHPIVEEVPEPRRGQGEVLLEVHAAALSHLDLSVSSGTFHLHPELPYVGGIEACGEVIAADDLAPGTQVLVRGGGVGLLRGGTWAERITVPRKSIMTLPVPLAPQVAATFFQPTSTAYVALHDVANLQPGELVIVVGAAGAVGAQVVQQALAAGARVLAAVGRTEQLERIATGATPVLITDDLAQQLSTEPEATLLVDTLGGPNLMDRLHWVRPGGRAVVIGYVAGTAVEVDLPSWFLTGVALLPVNMIRKERRARSLAPTLIQQLAQGDLAIDVQAFALEDIAEGLARLQDGKVRGRAVVQFDHPSARQDAYMPS